MAAGLDGRVVWAAIPREDGAWWTWPYVAVAAGCPALETTFGIEPRKNHQTSKVSMFLHALFLPGFGVQI